MGLCGAGPLHRAPRFQMCCEEAFLRHPAAAQALLQTRVSATDWHLSLHHQALQEPGDSDELHLQSFVSLFPPSLIKIYC